MKFGKLIRREATLEWNLKWADFYVDYKLLKKIIRVQLRAAREPRELTDLFIAYVDHFQREKSKVVNFLKNESRNFDEKFDTECTGSERKEHVDILQWTIRLRNLAKFRKVNFDALFKLNKKLLKYLKNCLVEDPDGPTANWARDEIEDLEDTAIQYLEKLSAESESNRASYIDLHNSFRSKMEETFSQPVQVNFDEEAAVEIIQDIGVDDGIPVLEELVLESLPPGKISKIKVAIQQDATGDWIVLHVLVAKGKFDGPVLGLTSALHGNELNGIPLIFRLMREIDVDQMRGTLVAIPVCNPPGYLRKQRGFSDGQDLNRLFPGKVDGDCGKSYVYHFLHKVVKKFDFHIDLHTASTGRVNSLYCRADMNNPFCNQMALLQKPQIIVHNTAPDGSLRMAAMAFGIPSITLEIGDPLAFHKTYVATALDGVESVMKWLHLGESLDAAEESRKDTGNTTPPYRMYRADSYRADSLFCAEPLQQHATTICSSSKWLYSQHGGILRVLPDVNQWVEKDQVIARVQNLYGEIVATYRAPADGIIVGKSTNPICGAGDRIAHIGYVGDRYAVRVDDGHA